MDKYKVKETVAHGVLSVVYKVESEKKETRILKKIECLDALNAQLAFQELKAFESIKHHHICKIHDLFVEWDKSISSAFLCFTMDHYTEGDLGTFLNKHREKSEIVPLELVKKWTGILVEGMNYLFKYNLVHRNLKPSSLYLCNFNLNNNKQDLSLQIGDFGVYTIMKDAKTKTRIPPGAHDYVAPEIIDAQSFDEKSDIWSIGAILLDACTTSLYDHKEFHQRLLNVRHSDEVLDETIADVDRVYACRPLHDLLKSLLQKNKTKRLDYKSIIDRPFVKDCLGSVDSTLVKYRGKPDAGPSDVPLPIESAEKLTKFLSDNLRFEARVQAATQRLAELSEIESFKFEHELEIMSMYENNLKIQASILKLIESTLKLAVKSARNQEPQFIDVQSLQKFIYIFIKHGASYEIQTNALKCLIQFSNFDSVSSYFAKYNVIKHLLKGIEKFHDDSLFCGLACKAIWCLASFEDIIKTYVNMKCLLHMRDILIRHYTDAFCVQMVCNVIIALSMHERIINDEEIEVDITSAILCALKENIAVPDVVKSACIAVTSLVNLHEECAFRFIYLPKSQDVDEIDGIDLLRRAYETHKDDSEVVGYICGVFKQLCIYDEMIVELKSLRLDERLFTNIIKRYRDNKGITTQCDFICQKITEKLLNEQQLEIH